MVLKDFMTESLTDWFVEWLMKQDLEKDIIDRKIELKRRQENPDWERPIVMYGVRKMGHKCIKKQEIAVVIDRIPWVKRARMAETHWYCILYKRPATDMEWEGIKGRTRRYVVWSYFVEKDWGVDRIISNIVDDDINLFRVSPNVTSEIVEAFKKYYKRPIRVYKPDRSKQLEIEF